MGSILGLLKRVEQLDTDQVVLETLQESEDFMGELNTKQINNGIKADGTEMPHYSARAVSQGKPDGPIRLRETGAWQKGLYAKVDIATGVITFASTDSKDKFLPERWGVEIEGLSAKNKAEAMRELVRPKFKTKMEAAVGLSFKGSV